MTAQDEIRAFINRVLRLKEEQDSIGDDIKDVYAEAKASGFDKTQLGNVVSHLRKVSKKGADAVEEQNSIFETYLAAYEGRAHTHARESDEPFDAETGEIIESPRKAAEAVSERTAAGELDAGRSSSAPITEISTSAERVKPHRQGSAVANAGGEDVDRSALRAPVEAGPVHNSLAGGLESGIEHSFVDEPASGPDVKRAPNSPGTANGVPAQDGEGTALGASHGDKSNTARPASVDAHVNDGRLAGEVSAEVVTVGGDESGTAAPIPAHIPSFLTRPAPPLRPHCLHPGDMCGGYGSKHCHSCELAMREREAA